MGAGQSMHAGGWNTCGFTVQRWPELQPRGSKGEAMSPLFPELECAVRGWLTSLPAQLAVFFVLSEIFYF